MDENLRAKEHQDLGKDKAPAVDRSADSTVGKNHSDELTEGQRQELLAKVEAITREDREELKARMKAWSIRLELREMRQQGKETTAIRKKKKELYDSLNVFLSQKRFAFTSYCSSMSVAPKTEE
jgi:hypothetical protein